MTDRDWLQWMAEAGCHPAVAESKICVCRCAQPKKLLTSPFGRGKSATHTDSVHTWALLSSPVVWPPSLHLSCLYYDIMVCVRRTAEAELAKSDVNTVAVWIDKHLALQPGLYCSSNTHHCLGAWWIPMVNLFFTHDNASDTKVVIWPWLSPGSLKVLTIVRLIKNVTCCFLWNEITPK